LYYSLADWRFNGYYNYQTDLESAQALKEQVYTQVRELLSQYGKIDYLYYDAFTLDHENHLAVTGSTGFYEPPRLNALVRSLQPGIIINDRSGGGAAEDVDTPEQHIAASRPGRAWETCMTIGDAQGWGYVRHNPNWKTVPALLQCLSTAASGEGNFLLNIGPCPGRHDPRRRDGAFGDHGAVATRPWRRHLWLPALPPAFGQRRSLDSPENTAYLHVFRWPGEQVEIPWSAAR
jgi:alpha-L-fucosidase